MKLSQNYEVRYKRTDEKYDSCFIRFISDSTDTLILTGEWIGECRLKGESEWLREYLQINQATRIFSELSHKVWVIGSYEIVGDYSVNIQAERTNPNYKSINFSLDRYKLP